MTKTYYIDKRIMPNGKTSNINLDNYLNLPRYIKEVVSPLILTSETTINETINSLSNTVIVEETYAAQPIDYRIMVAQTSLEAVTITLPTAASNLGKTYFIQAITFTDPVSIIVDGIELINGNTSVVLNALYEYVEVVAANDQWYIVNSNYTPA